MIFHFHPVKFPPATQEGSGVTCQKLQRYLYGNVRLATPYVAALLAQTISPGLARTAELNILRREGMLSAAANDGHQLETLTCMALVKVSQSVFTSILNGNVHLCINGSVHQETVSPLSWLMCRQKSSADHLQRWQSDAARVWQALS